MNIITLEMVESKNPCPGGLAHFKELFPKGYVVNGENAARYAHVFTPIGCVAWMFLTAYGYKAWAKTVPKVNPSIKDDDFHAQLINQALVFTEIYNLENPIGTSSPRPPNITHPSYWY